MNGKAKEKTILKYSSQEQEVGCKQTSINPSSLFCFSANRLKFQTLQRNAQTPQKLWFVSEFCDEFINHYDVDDEWEDFQWSISLEKSAF